MNVFIQALAQLIGALAPIMMKAWTAHKEDHDTIMAEAQAAINVFSDAVASLSPALAQDDAAADAEIDSIPTKP